MKLTDALFVQLAERLSTSQRVGKVILFKVDDQDYFVKCFLDKEKGEIRILHLMRHLQSTPTTDVLPIQEVVPGFFESVLTSMFGSNPSEEKTMMQIRLYASLITLRDEKELKSIIGLLDQEKPAESRTWDNKPVDFPLGTSSPVDVFRLWLRS